MKALLGTERPVQRYKMNANSIPILAMKTLFVETLTKVSVVPVMKASPEMDFQVSIIRVGLILTLFLLYLNEKIVMLFFLFCNEPFLLVVHRSTSMNVNYKRIIVNKFATMYREASRVLVIPDIHLIQTT